MKQLKATQNSPQYGPLSLYLRIVGKILFLKGVHSSTPYVDKLIADFKKRGATIVKGNGGWVMVDIIKSNKEVKLGDYYITQDEMTPEQIEIVLFKFFFKKYREAKFLVQEVLEDDGR